MALEDIKQKRKQSRMRERVKLQIPARVQCRESLHHEWMELTRLLDVTPFGVGLTLTRLTEPGRLLLLTLPMPRQLRCFDHAEDQYRVWGLVRHVSPYERLSNQVVEKLPGIARYEVGVAFIGKYPPLNYTKDPAIRYEIATTAEGNNLWNVREMSVSSALDASAASSEHGRSTRTRLQMAVEVLIEVIDERGAVLAHEQTVTENLSRGGAAVWTTLPVERGRFVRMRSVGTPLTIMAAVRSNRAGADGIARLHLEFIDREWPIEGLE